MRVLYLMFVMAMTSLAVCADDVPQLGKDNLDLLIRSMTLEEKIRLLTGSGEVAEDMLVAIGHTDKIVPGAAGTTYPISRLGIPAIVMADGPAGLRIDSRREGSGRTYYCTAFPVATLLASSWNTDLVEAVGKAMGNEVLEYGCDVLLAPALNIHRNPLCGRNYEYYSEDPYLTGRMAVAMVNGIQSNGVGTSVKHFAVNNQETNRIANNAIVSQRALREIYLKGFEMVVKEAHPWTVMSSYNKVNGTYTSESHELLAGILREDWGYDGLVVTDWFGGRDAVAQVKAGNDLLMPGKISQQDSIRKAVDTGRLSMSDIDRNVRRILELIVKTPRFRKFNYSEHPDLKKHACITRKAAAEGMILLKNENHALPLGKRVRKAAVFGNTSYRFITGGTGSGDVEEAYSVSLEEGLAAAGFELDCDLKDRYIGYIAVEEQKIDRKIYNHVTPPRIAECPLTEEVIQRKAESADIAMITLGRNAGEYSDRCLDDDFEISADERELLEKVCLTFHKMKKKVVVILNVGGVVETSSWKDLPDAVLLSWQAGQEGGHSVADILVGKVNPSGKLPMTFPVNYQDAASSCNFPVIDAENAWKIYREFYTGPQGYDRKDIDYTRYEEDIWVGYRYFDKQDVAVSYPFGYGLSYTTFRISDAISNFNQDGLHLVCTVDNTGDCAGKEVLQVYISAPDGRLVKPVRELKAFAKTRRLEPGESQRFEFHISPYELSSFCESDNNWILEKGQYKVLLGTSSRDIRLESDFFLENSIVISK